jgi:hypothetical protein
MNSTPGEHPVALQILEDSGLGGYIHALDTAGDSGKGRIRMMIWQAVFQHLMIRRRILCREAELDFYEVEKKAEAAVKRLGVVDAPLSWLLVYVHTRRQVRGDRDYWDTVRAML